VPAANHPCTVLKNIKERNPGGDAKQLVLAPVVLLADPLDELVVKKRADFAVKVLLIGGIDAIARLTFSLRSRCTEAPYQLA